MCDFVDFILPGREKTRPKVVAALGVFDGVHAGHRSVTAAAVRIAGVRGTTAAALTFQPHPRAVVTNSAPPLLIPFEKRLELLKASGVAAVGTIRFTPEVAAWEPEKFLAGLLEAPGFALDGITVGCNWRFGRGGSGTAETAEKFCFRHGLGFAAIPEKMLDGTPISSTAIRQAVAAGELERASSMLGRPPALFGTVVGGMQIAGKELRAPTANLAVECGILPPDGVYAGRSTVAGTLFPAVLNIGSAPTFGVTERRIEVHLIGFSGSLYETKLEVELDRFLRPIRRFNNADALRRQIAADIAASVISSEYQKGENK